MCGTAREPLTHLGDRIFTDPTLPQSYTHLTVRQHNYLTWLFCNQDDIFEVVHLSAHGSSWLSLGPATAQGVIFEDTEAAAQTFPLADTRGGYTIAIGDIGTSTVPGLTLDATTLLAGTGASTIVSSAISGLVFLTACYSGEGSFGSSTERSGSREAKSLSALITKVQGFARRKHSAREIY